MGLADASSALKEVSAAGNRNDGAILEKVLETNLKFRRDCLGEIQAKLHRATGERQNFGRSSASASDRKKADVDVGGFMKKFFNEVSLTHAHETEKMADQQTSLL